MDERSLEQIRLNLIAFDKRHYESVGKLSTDS